MQKLVIIDVIKIWLGEQFTVKWLLAIFRVFLGKSIRLLLAEFNLLRPLLNKLNVTRISIDEYTVWIVPTYYADLQPGAFWITDLCCAFGSASTSVISLGYRPRKFKLEFQPLYFSETGILFDEPSILVFCKFSILLPNPYIYELCWDFFLPSCTWFKGQIINSDWIRPWNLWFLFTTIRLHLHKNKMLNKNPVAWCQKYPSMSKVEDFIGRLGSQVCTFR